MKKLLTICMMCLLFQGCSGRATLTLENDIFIPNIKTANGGSFGDPSKSRGQTMRTSTNSNRNNDGGNSGDRICRKFFRTGSRK